MRPDMNEMHFSFCKSHFAEIAVSQVPLKYRANVVFHFTKAILQKFSQRKFAEIRSLPNFAHILTEHRYLLLSFIA